jgi:signal transduction histidine kinase
MLTEDIHHPLVFGLFVAELVAFVVFAHQGVIHALLYRSSRRRELLQYAIWCAWSAALPLTQMTVVLRVSPGAKLFALHAMSIVVPMMMQSYLASIAVYLGVENRFLRTLVRWQPLLAVPPLASAIGVALGWEPFFLREPATLSMSPVLATIQTSCPRNEVHPAYLAAAVATAIADVTVLVVGAWRAPRRDAWVLGGIVITCVAVAFEITVFWSGSRFAMPAIFAANLVEVLRITYVATRRAGEESALLQRELEQQHRVVASQLAALDASSRLATLGELASEIGHEMRNPVASAALFIDAARRRAAEGGPVQEPLEKASAALQQLGTLVTGMARYDRDAAERGRVVVRAAIDDAVVLCAHRLHRVGAELDVTVPEAISAYGTNTELIQIFVNLLANACDAIDAADERWIRISASLNGKRVMVRVCDAGATPTSAAEAMFSVRFTTKREGEGTGLGLRICRRLVETLGGSIKIDRHAPTTTIVLELPAWG